MDVVRINSAHLDIEGALKIIRNVREVSEQIAILIDTKGPEIRTTVCDNPITVAKGDTIYIEGNPHEKSIPVGFWLHTPHLPKMYRKAFLC
jgi:pyruvate kinase